MLPAAATSDVHVSVEEVVGAGDGFFWLPVQTNVTISMTADNTQIVMRIG